MSRVSVKCPGCGKSHDVEESWLGRKGRCKNCHIAFVLTRNQWAKGELVLGDFEVEGRLGEGGMGTVYRVRSRSTNQRFGVKKAQFHDETSQRNFLNELQTWIDLPDHSHLAACRFFRTVGEEIAIFAEYADRGSLQDLIQNRRLTRLEDILDLAIQFAWGLHAAQEWGLIHRDVKPGNALWTSAETVKVTDFGLAGARAAADGTSAGRAAQSILISSGGMTPAYCSPEQANGRPLSRKTDVWSWGVSVLEMFTGEVTWRSGVVAPEVLQEYLKNGPINADLPTMPDRVADVLRQCFRHDPSERWASLSDAAEELRCAYRPAVGTNYSRPAPAFPRRGSLADVAHDRRTTSGAQWTDPREWLVRALAADGRDASEAAALLPTRQGSRKAQAIADLAAYNQARLIFERLVAGGRKDLDEQLATLCVEKALIHEHTDDVPGALALYDRAIEIRERLVEREGRRELANDLAMACMNKAIAVSDLGDLRAAVALYDRAIEIYERLVEREGRRELRGNLALVVAYRAGCYRDIGDPQRAAADVRKTVAILNEEIDRTDRADLKNVRDWVTKNLGDFL